MSYLNFYRHSAPVPLNIAATAFNAGNVSSGGIILYAATSDHLIITKPRVLDSGGLLTWDGYSLWPSDGSTSPPPPVAGQTWNNNFLVYASNGGAETLIGGATLSSNLYATEDDAWNAVNAIMPLSYTGYTRYRVTCGLDPNPGDNRNGLSLLAHVE